MPYSGSKGHLHGFIVIDKPASWTSHDVISRMRRLLGERRIGHAGTLDPAATGVLPIGVGYATRLMEFLADADKSYLATVHFGVETDSHDGDGYVTRVCDATALTVDRIESAIAGWRGSNKMQVPPMHSAIKIRGTRLYEHARRGEAIDRPERSVTFHDLRLLHWSSPEATIFMRCSKGTYVRSLARDLGRELGTGAYLANLVRYQTGPFCLDQAWTLLQIEDLWQEQGDAAWEYLAHHPDTVVSDSPALILDDAVSHNWLAGSPIDGRRDDLGRCRAYDVDGHWLGVGTWDGSAARWRPNKVMTAQV
jgi:tRNA pseudouridine55 synthase